MLIVKLWVITKLSCQLPGIWNLEIETTKVTVQSDDG